MATKSTQTVKVMVNGKEKEIKGRRLSPKSLLEAFEKIIDLAKDSELKEEFFIKAGPDIRYICKKLGLTEIQAVLLAVFVGKSEDTRIRPSEIASFLEINTIKMLRYLDDIDMLVEKHYLKTSKRHDDRTYAVPDGVIKAFRKNEPYVYVEEDIKDTQEFFDKFKVLLKEKDNDELDYDRFEERTLHLMDDIKESVFVRSLERYSLPSSLKMLFIFIAHMYVNRDDNDVRFSDIEDMYDDQEVPRWIRRELRSHECELFNLNLIENVNEEGMAKPDAFKLTDFSKTTILSEVSMENIGKSTEGLVKFENLAEKRLIYNKEEENLISELTSILSQKRFSEVQTRLKDSGMRQGFCCIFYGSPGTGKTESVYQLAKKTGRNILQVDVDKIKSCWVGESEKNIKALFDRYRNICKNSEVAPILLFNEADAVLGTRMEGASKAVDKMENSIQNIILQEMEKLDGIMIATTNLTSNLDKAFERRFLYKVKFEKPSVESRAEIWKVMLPGIKKKDAIHLSSKFDLSGGEIENVVRRHTVQSILTGKDKIDIKALEESCKLERLSKISHTKVGF